MLSSRICLLLIAVYTAIQQTSSSLLQSGSFNSLLPGKDKDVSNTRLNYHSLDEKSEKRLKHIGNRDRDRDQTSILRRIRGGSTLPASDVAPPSRDNSHTLSIYEVLAKLRVEENFGLTSADAAERLAYFGPNQLQPPPKKELWRLVMEQFEDRLVQILVAVAALSGILATLDNDPHAVTEPFVIISILVINAIVGVLQSKSAEDSIDALKKLQPESACVLRDGIWKGELPVAEVVPGDIIYLRVGDKIPADARILSLKTTTFSTDEGSLTGESATVSKDSNVVLDLEATITSKSNMLFSGTLVTNGACYAVVTNTAMNTEIGKISAGVELASHDVSKTPLAIKLDEFGQQLTKIIGLICAGVFLISIPRFKNPVFKNWIEGAYYHAKVAVALGVAAIPEGLPMVITLCLSLGTNRMAKRNVIVRKLPSVETLGCTSVICTDKTGTLTTNQMTVKSLVTIQRASSAGEGDSHTSDESVQNDSNDSTVKVKDTPNEACELIERELEGVSYEPLGQIQGLTELSPAVREIATIASLCNEAQIEFKDGQFCRIGEPTEAALKVLVEKIGAGFDKSTDPVLQARQCNDYWASLYDKLATLEFSRDRKSMSVLCRSRASTHTPLSSSEETQEHNNNASPPTATSTNRLFVKGAAEVLCSRCSFIKLDDGQVVPMTDTIRSQVYEKVKQMAQRPLRCLALAYKEGDSLGSDLGNIATPQQATASQQLANSSSFIELESDLILVGLCGIKDPARPEAAEAILKCKDAGVRVMMMTGDSKDTAVAIAREVNILTDEEAQSGMHAFTGQEFFSLPGHVQLELLHSGNKVFCRTEPQDKQKLISMLKKLNEIVAMTGDGVNDAPALQQADIGIAMGRTGTEVAKNAADMILSDDNFVSIVNGVEEGRNIFANMQTFVCFLISCNIGEIATIFLATLLGLPEPLTALHLLWINLVTDGPPATALGFNPPDAGVMKKKPRPAGESIMSQWLLIRYIITGTYVGVATVGAFVWWFLDKGVTFSQLLQWGKCIETDASLNPELSLPSGVSSMCSLFQKQNLATPQSVSLSVLVTMEMLKALSAVSLNSSLLQLPPWRNPWLLLGVAVPFLLHIAVLYVKPFAHLFGLAPLTVKEWQMVLKFAMPILLVEELLKYIGRVKLKSAGQQKKLTRVPAPHF